MSGTAFDPEDPFESALRAVLAGPELRGRAAGELKSIADRSRRPVERRTALEQAAYRRALAEEQGLALARRRSQFANFVLLVLAVLLAFLLALVDYLLLVRASAGLAVGFLVVVCIIVALVYPRSDEDRQRLAAWRAAVRVPSWSARDAERLDGAGSRVVATAEVWGRSLGDAILARLLASRADPKFSVVLQTLRERRLPAGLRESLDVSFHVETRTGDRLAHLMRDLRGGSFALVGARGTGKTDLLGALTLGAYADKGADPPLTVTIPAPVSYVPRDFVLQLFVVTCAATVSFVDLRLAEPDLEPALRTELRALRTRAEDERQQLLHQATTSTEAAATGGVGPVTLELRRGVSQSRLAQSYPGVVAELRAFLEHLESVLSRYPRQPVAGSPPATGARPDPAGEDRGVEVVVAIDELDRIESPDQARAFLHEVKGVLGVRNCCFIVALAEETLDAFDNAGKPIYDVLPRIFDEVVHMEYLDLATCGRVLATRVSPPFPPQYVGLCYSLSGGVARDVVRAARGIVGVSLRDGRDRLSGITGAIVEDETEELVEWARERLARIGGSAVVETVRGLYRTHPAGPNRDLRALLAELEQVVSGPEDAIEVASVCDRTRSTAYFLRTILDVFDDRLDGERYKRGLGDPHAGSLESLARARRWLGANDPLAVALVDAFRDAWGMS